MTGHNDDFEARLKRVKARKGPTQPLTRTRQQAEPDFALDPIVVAVLLMLLALILGAVALVAGRAIAMNGLGIEPDIHHLGIAEGGVVLGLLLGIGLLFSRRPSLSHAALIVGAVVAFLGERFYIPMMPALMEVIYTPLYVAEVVLEYH